MGPGECNNLRLGYAGGLHGSGVLYNFHNSVPLFCFFDLLIWIGVYKGPVQGEPAILH